MLHLSQIPSDAIELSRTKHNNCTSFQPYQQNLSFSWNDFTLRTHDMHAHFFFIYSDNPQNKKGLRKLKTTEVDILQEVTNTNQSHYTRRNGQKNRVGKQWSYKKMRKNLAAVGFEPTPPGRLVPKTSALDHSATLPLTPAAAWYATIPFMIATVLLL